MRPPIVKRTQLGWLAGLSQHAASVVTCTPNGVSTSRRKAVKVPFARSAPLVRLCRRGRLRVTFLGWVDTLADTSHLATVDG